MRPRRAQEGLRLAGWGKVVALGGALPAGGGRVTQSSEDADRQDPVGCPGAAVGIEIPGTGRPLKGLRFAGGQVGGDCGKTPGIASEGGSPGERPGWQHKGPPAGLRSQGQGREEGGMPGLEPRGGMITAHRKADQSSGIPELRAAERRCNRCQTEEQWTWADRGPGVGGAHDSRRAPKLERGDARGREMP